MSPPFTSQRRGLTLVEILVVIGMIVLLVSLVVVAVGRISDSAARTQSANALREMISAYSGYSADHNQRLMPGYIDPDSIGPGLPFNPRITHDNLEVPPEALASYVWRLKEYLDGNWQTTLRDYVGNDIRDRVESSLGAADEDGFLLAATSPAFGLNSIFVGGHDTFESEIRPTLDIPAEARIAATRLSQVRNPASLIVFGPAARADADMAGTDELDPYILEGNGDGFALGHHELRAPALAPHSEDAGPGNLLWTERQWATGTGARLLLTTSGVALDAIDFGIPIVRRGQSRMPVANLDGSVNIADVAELSEDMRRWSPFVTGSRPAGIVD